MARIGLTLTPGQRRAGFVLGGIVLGGLGVATPVLRGTHARGTLQELVGLAVFAVVAGLWLSFVTPDRSGALVVINPAVCFTFALMLSWGVIATLGAQLASVAVLTWRWRLPLRQGLRQTVQFVGSYLVAFGVLRLGGTPGPRGREWTSLHDAAVVAGAAVAWLIAYLALAYAFASPDSRRRAAWIGNGLLFNAALVVLSPVVAVTGERSVALVALLLLPLYATARMARLSVERERLDRLDSLTSLANRTALRESFERAVAGVARTPEEGLNVLLVLNLDRFKYINDSLGYELGDQLLVSTARRLAGIYGDGDTVARLGADEFAVLAHVADLDTAAALASRTVRAVREPVLLSGLQIEVTASVGLAPHDRMSDDFVAVLRHADAAMHDAKRHGNDMAVYHDHAGDGSVEGLRLLADFRDALTASEDDSVAMHYQPQVSLATGAIDGLEALLRWTHPVHGAIDAMTIVGLAEQTTVMNLLTTRVIAEVTAQAASWRRDGLTLRVAFNISARDLYSETIAARLAERLAQHGLPAQQLQVEVTESALTTDPVRARGTLSQIAELGVEISLDDFGTGFTSLQQVRGTPLSEIKIDQTFVKGMMTSRDDAAIVASTVNLAHGLGLRAVAEGIEEQATLEALRKLGCDVGQGWHISRPVPAERIPALIAERLSRQDRRPDAVAEGN